MKKYLGIIYWISTILLTGLMLFSTYMYFTQTTMIQDFFVTLGYPYYLPIPLAIAKILGLIAIWSNFNLGIREWAYAGFFFDTVLAATAHIQANDGAHWMAVGGIFLVLLSYISYKIKPITLPSF